MIREGKKWSERDMSSQRGKEVVREGKKWSEREISGQRGK